MVGVRRNLTMAWRIELQLAAKAVILTTDSKAERY